MSLPDGLDWLLRPVERGWCQYESLKNGTLDLADVAVMNEAIGVFDENQRRIQDAVRSAQQRT
ncbi:DUF6889 family protein [Xanthobacter flavus]|uniref:DUF6889 family protein n=1 Tax=Xanthobacter flavus TaxID=281 RepID=UPI00372D799E